jgi:hypothetical protein
LRRSWTARTARSIDEAFMITVTLYSEEPWAIATTLTPLSPRALKIFPAMPCCPRIPAPTTDISAMPRSMVRRATSSPRNPCSRKSRSSALAVRSTSASAMAKEMLYSDDDIDSM